MNERERHVPEKGVFTDQHTLDLFVRETSSEHHLDPMSAEALGKLAHMSYRIRQIYNDFSDPSVNEKKYRGWSGNGPKISVRLTRDCYEEYTGIIFDTAKDLFDEYLSGNISKKIAVKEVMDFLDESF
jgi:hypothetical protein